MSNFGTPRYTGHRKGTIWKEQVKIVGDYLDFTDDEVVTKLGLGMITSNTECAMDTAVRYTLVSKGEDIELSAKEMVNEYTIIAHYIERNIIADAGAGRWVVSEYKHSLWTNEKSSGWRYDNPHIHTNNCRYNLVGEENKCKNWKGKKNCPYHKKNGSATQHNLFMLDVVRRELINDADQKEVLRAINKSLNRMMNTGKVVKTSEGRGRTFKWTDWSWLKEYRQQHLFSESKKRKVGDKVNGWVYSVVSSKEIHGVKIDSHGWLPIETIKYYTLELPSRSYYGSSQTVSAFFLDEDSRDAMYESVNSFIQTSLTPLQMPRRTWRGNKMKTQTPIVFNKNNHTVVLTLKADTVVENLPDPLEFFKQVNYNHKRREELSQFIHKADRLYVVNHSVKKVEVVA